MKTKKKKNTMESYEVAELFGIPVLVIPERVPDEEVPDGIYKYEIRAGEYENGDYGWTEVSGHITVDFDCTIYSSEEIPASTINDDDYGWFDEYATIDEFINFRN